MNEIGKKINSCKSENISVFCKTENTSIKISGCGIQCRLCLVARKYLKPRKGEELD